MKLKIEMQPSLDGPRLSLSQVLREFADAVDQGRAHPAVEYTGPPYKPQTPRRPLTEAQAKMLETLRTYAQRYGHMPSLRELCALTGITSTNGVTDHLRALENKGYLRLTPETARGIVLL